jgi:hypothetical protein
MGEGRGAHRRDDNPSAAPMVLLVVLFIALGVVALFLGLWWVTVYCAVTLLATWAFSSALREIRRDRL